MQPFLVIRAGNKLIKSRPSIKLKGGYQILMEYDADENGIWGVLSEFFSG